jgi:hypothetical protein
MKVIFLDVDGVLNRLDGMYYRKDVGYNLSRNIYPPYPIDKEKIEMVMKLAKETKAKIVLSSSWRREDKGMAKLVEFGLGIFDTTDKNSYAKREETIKNYLIDNNVNNYVILDDNSDYFFISDEIAKHALTIDAYNGLTDSDIEKARDILNGENI